MSSQKDKTTNRGTSLNRRKAHTPLFFFRGAEGGGSSSRGAALVYIAPRAQFTPLRWLCVPSAKYVTLNWVWRLNVAWVGSKGGFWGVDIFFVCYKSMRCRRRRWWWWWWVHITMAVVSSHGMTVFRIPTADFPECFRTVGWNKLDNVTMLCCCRVCTEECLGNLVDMTFF